MPRCFCQIYTHNNLTLSIGARSIDLQCEPCYNAVRQDYIESVLHRYEKAHEMAVSWAF